MLNNKGTILQIVLVLCMVITTTLVATAKVVVDNARALQRIEEVNITRNIEIELLEYFRTQAREGTLSTNKVHIKDATIQYQVSDEQTDQYLIKAKIDRNQKVYSVSLFLQKDTLVISQFLYQ